MIDDVLAAGNAAGPGVERILAQALWIKTIALERSGQAELALRTLGELMRRQSLRGGRPGSWEYDVGLAEIRLLHHTGQFSAAIGQANEYIERYDSRGSQARFHVLQARWFRRFARAHVHDEGVLGVIPVDADFDPRVQVSSREDFAVTGRAAHMVLWESLQAEATDDVLDVLSELESAFEREEDPRIQIFLGANLIEEADWFGRVGRSGVTSA